MDLSITPEALLTQQRADFLNSLGNAAQATQQAAQKTALGEISDTAINLQSLNTSITLPVDPSRGQSLDIRV